MLPMVYAEPELAREVLRYSLQQQTAGRRRDPLRDGAAVHRASTSARPNDLDFWLLLALAEYVLATRDTAFLDERIPFAAACPARRWRAAAIWEHVKLAVRHQETLAGARPRRPLPDRTDRRLVGLLDRCSCGSTESVARHRPARLRLPAARRGRRPARRHRVRRRAARRSAAQPAACSRDEWTGARLVLARLLRADADRARARSSASRSPGRCWPARPTREQAATLVANIARFLRAAARPPELRRPVARSARRSRPSEDDPAVDRDAIARRRRRRQQRRLRRWHLVRDQRTARLGARRARRRRPRRRARGARRARAQHAERPRRRVPDALERGPQRRRRLLVVLLDASPGAAASACS